MINQIGDLAPMMTVDRFAGQHRERGFASEAAPLGHPTRRCARRLSQQKTKREATISQRSTSSILATSSWSRSGLPRLEQQYPQGVRTELSSGAGCGLAACQQRAETLHSRPGAKQTCGEGRGSELPASRLSKTCCACLVFAPM